MGLFLVALFTTAPTWEQPQTFAGKRTDKQASSGAARHRDPSQQHKAQAVKAQRDRAKTQVRPAV